MTDFAENEASHEEITSTANSVQPAQTPQATPEEVSTGEPKEFTEDSVAPEPAGPPEDGAGAKAEPVAGIKLPPKVAVKPKPVTDTGRILEGVVTAVSADAVELTLDDGRSAVINRRNFGVNNEDPSTLLSVGDRSFGAELAREDPQSRVVLSRVWALKRRSWEKIEAAAEKGEPLSGRVLSASTKGVVVDVGVRGFVPLSHLELEPVTDAAAYIGQTLELKVLDVDPRREKLVLSRRSQLMKAQRKQERELLTTMKPGEVRSGKVVSLAQYGAFVDVGGVSGLVHISELSWERVGKPSDVVSVGDEVTVKVLEVKTKKKRISLSMRQCLDDPLSNLEIGSIHTGRVTRLVDFGAFVTLGTLEGLVHLSELAEYRVTSPEEIVTPGDEVRVKVLSVDPRRRRIELSIRRAAEFQG